MQITHRYTLALQIQALSEQGIPDRAFSYLRHVFKQRYAFVHDGDISSLQETVTNMLRGDSCVGIDAGPVTNGSDQGPESTSRARANSRSGVSVLPALVRRVINNSPYRSAFAAPSVAKLQETFPLVKSGTGVETINLVEISPALESTSSNARDQTTESSIR